MHVDKLNTIVEAFDMRESVWRVLISLSQLTCSQLPHLTLVGM